MKKLIVLSLLFVSTAFAGNVWLTSGQYVRLPECGGSVEASQDATQATLVFQGVQNCSNFDIFGANGESVQYPNKKLGGVNQNRSGSFTIPKDLIQLGSNNIQVVVKSNSGKTSDRINISFFSWNTSNLTKKPILRETLSMKINSESRLPECGGEVRITKSPAGQGLGEQLNIVFEDVQNCSKFDILASDGEPVNYKTKALQQNNAGYVGSFTIPPKFINWGSNSLLILVRSNSGKHDDVIRVRFTSY
jgi:hypothetical protein